MKYYLIGIDYGELLSLFQPLLQERFTDAVWQMMIGSFDSEELFERGKLTSFGTGFRIEKDTLIATGSGPIIFRASPLVKAYIKYIVIEDGVFRIPARCFEHANAYSIVHHGYIPSIGEKAYASMPNLEEADINTHAISEGCFENSPHLRSIHIGSEVCIIQKNAFANCPQLKTIFYYGERGFFPKIVVEEGNMAFTNARVFYMTHE